MKICVIDENYVAMESLVSTLQSTSLKFSNKHLQIDGFSSVHDFLDTLKKGNYYDMYFLEMMYEHVDGKLFIETIKKLDNEAKIVLVTASIRYALTAFELNAYNFVLKPLEIAKAYEIIHKAMQENHHNVNKTLYIKHSNGYKRVHISHLMYVEIKDHQLYYHLFNNSLILTFGRLVDAADKLLPFYDFIQPHRSFLVNLNYVTNIKSNTLILNNHTIPISSTYAAQTKSMYKSFIEKKGILL